jgi:Zn-dependent protease with chaperone function
MIDAIYFDGKSARRHPVTLIIHLRVAAMRGAGLNRRARLSQLDISERLQHAPRILRFPDGAFIEAHQHAQLDRMLDANGYRTPRAVRWQNNWPLSLLALVLVILTLATGYQWGLPLAADKLAQHLPPALEKRIGDQSFALLEEQLLAPSRLSADYQARLRGQFAALRQPRGEQTAYRLEFRAGRIGPNALALPNGVIVITDDMVRLADSDEALLGVLSHELGHVQRHHATRQILQALGLGVMLNLWAGDVSSALSATPAILLTQSYSRDFEREADQYAIDMMRANARPLEPMAVLFETIAGLRAGGDEDDGDDDEPGADAAGGAAPDEAQAQSDVGAPEGQEEVLDFFSSHPSDAERIARFRAADRQQ